MFRIFNGVWRGSDQQEKTIFINLDVKFREILYKFKGAKLSVLIYLALRMDENGECYPSYDLMEKETGYSRPVLSAAIQELCNTDLDGKKILMRWRTKDEKGKFTGSTHYKIFPSETESKENPELENPTCGETSLEVRTKELKEEPINARKKTRSKKPISEELNPETPGEKYVFECLKRDMQRHYTPNWNGYPRRFKTPAQRDKFRAAEKRLGAELKPAVDAAMVKGMYSIAAITNWVSAWHKQGDSTDLSAYKSREVKPYEIAEE